MIMNGTTPRLLGVWGTLGSLGLAAVLLPVNATWAQKAEEAKEITIVVKPDDEADEPTEAIATFDGGLVNVVTKFVATAKEDGSPSEVRIEIKTDDSSDKVVADSIDQAIKKIKGQIEVIQKETKPTDQQKIRVKALEHAVRQLEATAKKTKALKQIASKKEAIDSAIVKSKKEAINRAVVNKVGKIEEIRATTMTPEKKAEIDKARARVKELAGALHAKQKELAEAQVELSKLERSLRSEAGAVKVAPLLEKQAVRIRELQAKPQPSSAKIERQYTINRESDSDKRRLEDLEKKLDKLLDEVKTLKRDRAK